MQLTAGFAGPLWDCSGCANSIYVTADGRVVDVMTTDTKSRR